MKGILKFNLPKENEEFKLANNGPKYALVVEELDNWLRNKYKYADEVSVGIEAVRHKLNKLLQEYNLIGE